MSEGNPFVLDIADVASIICTNPNSIFACLSAGYIVEGDTVEIAGCLTAKLEAVTPIGRQNTIS